MSHRAHPTADDPPSALLWDDCHRCDDQSADPTGLDDQSLARAWGLMLAVERHVEFRGTERPNEPHYLTANEARLGRTLNAIYIVVERLGGVHKNGRPGNA